MNPRLIKHMTDAQCREQLERVMQCFGLDPETTDFNEIFHSISDAIENSGRYEDLCR